MPLTEYNSRPKDMAIMTTDDWDKFFSYCIEKEEYRQTYEKTIFDTMVPMRIYWVNREKNLGFAIAKPKYDADPEFYRIGTNEQWKQFTTGFAAQFAGDNS